VVVRVDACSGRGGEQDSFACLPLRGGDCISIKLCMPWLERLRNEHLLPSLQPNNLAAGGVRLEEAAAALWAWDLAMVANVHARSGTILATQLILVYARGGLYNRWRKDTTPA